ncbi:MAG TPA: SURF1 family protein [Gemmatimonadaceae bacterium]
MSRRIILFSIISLALAALFTRLGFWQISRMHERQALNTYIESRMDSTPVPFFSLPHDSAATHYRRVTVNGTPDFAHEFYITEVSRSGSPGVYVVTPVRMPGRDTAVLVNRGWVYAPDASTIDPGRWHAPDSTFEGYVDEFQHPLPLLREPHHLRTINYAQISAQLPYPLADTYVVALGTDSVVSGVPLRIAPPPLDEGPFRSYAIQWFAFALISIGGATFVALKDHESRQAATRGETKPTGV